MRFLPLLFVVAACGSGEPPFPVDYETSWTQVADCRAGSVHGGDAIRIHVNAAAEVVWNDWSQRVLDSPSGVLPAGEMISFPPGAVLLKTQYSDSDCSQFKHWTMMTRLEVGADTDNGNWRWETIKKDEEGDATEPTTWSGCFDCHQNYRRYDYAGNPPNPN